MHFKSKAQITRLQSDVFSIVISAQFLHDRKTEYRAHFYANYKLISESQYQKNYFK